MSSISRDVQQNKKYMVLAGDVLQEKTNDDTSSEIMRSFIKNGIDPQLSQTRTRARATFLTSFFDVGGVKCASRSRGVASWTSHA